MKMPDTNQSAFDFWEELYQRSAPGTNGRPTTILQQLVDNKTPGLALDLGCAKGDDAVWLARQGWRVTAVDISPTVLGYAKANARRCGVEDQIEFQQHDLAESFPDSRFDLVTALFLQTPIEFPRTRVLRRAADSVHAGGVLLIVSHGKVAPWSWAQEGRAIPTAREGMEELNLDERDWKEIFVGSLERLATGPEGQSATVTDNVVALERI
ncbi:class I SAM-dependent methyltransferase [Roseibium sp.]|uniref:class I SAM-dependent methyltransferase n=1 Tax=Roseibium sp. TaxID=1936156 RepID=UPI003D0C1125